MDLIQGNYEESIFQCQMRFPNGFFAFCFAYTPSSESHFREIDRFLWESRHECRFKNRYQGPCVVDITSWSGQYPNIYFDTFLYFLKDIIADNQCVLITQTECIHSVVDRLSDFFNINIITLDNSKLHNKKTNRIGFYSVEEEKEEKCHV